MPCSYRSQKATDVMEQEMAGASTRHGTTDAMGIHYPGTTEATRQQIPWATRSQGTTNVTGQQKPWDNRWHGPHKSWDKGVTGQEKPHDKRCHRPAEARR